ncbi:MAG: 4Fe-4S binding protein [Methanoregula sp.]|nr:4Fe-4S binding protein [Methanoregula sp.]
MRNTILKGILPAGVAATTALVQPACAAVCPRGVGGCVFPGRCFLFVDENGNSLCDYTATALGSSSQHTVSVVDTPAIVSATGNITSSTLGSGSADAVTPGFLSLAPIILGICLFVALCGILIWLYTTKNAGDHSRSAGDLLAIVSLPALGIAGMILYLLMADHVSGMTFALVYMLAGVPIMAYLWRRRLIDSKIATIVLVISTATGFVFLAPLMPMEFTGIERLALGDQSITPGILAILAVLASSVLVGRIFCAHLCPVGALQELVSRIPGKKIQIKNPVISELFRAVIFAGVLMGGIYSTNVMAYTGIYDLFSLTLTAGFVVAAGLLIMSVFLYRPVCRFLCPFGLVFSLLTWRSRYSLRRTDACVDCSRCERACPVHTAGRTDSRRECYLCGRCTDTCRVDGAIVYGRE